MRRFLFFLLLPAFVFADQQSDFDRLKDELSADLVYIDLELQGQVSSLQVGLEQLNDFVMDNGGSSDYDRGYADGADAAANIVRSRINNAVLSLNQCRSYITAAHDVLLGMEPEEGKDYSPYLSVITNQLKAIVYSHEEVIKDKLKNIETAVNGINSKMSTLLSHASQLAVDVHTMTEFFTDENGMFYKFIELANARIDSPDVGLLDDLNTMWESTLENMASIITNASVYSIDAQITTPLADVDTHLSNEGLIALQNLAINERQYLCSVESLKYLKNTSSNSWNQVDWITNYLDRVQAPYYRIFDGFLSRWYSPNPFSVGVAGINYWSIATNLYNSTSRARRASVYTTFKNNYTNWFQRVEMHLMALNGMFDESDIVDSEEVSKLHDKENIERNLDYSTNSIFEAVHELSGVSNSFNTVKRKFNDLLSAWDIQQGGSSDSIRLLPSIDLGGIQIEHIDLTTEDFAFIRDGCRLVFSGIWYIIFGTLSFRYICYLFLCLGRTISRVALIVSTLMGK